MKNIIIAGVGLCVLIGLIIGNVWFHDLYQTEKESAAAAQKEIKKLESVIEASKNNKSENLTEPATEFINLVFTFGSESQQENADAILSHTTGKAYSELKETPNKAHDNHPEHLEGFESESHIIDTLYNKTSNSEGKVIVKFEQWLSKDGNVAKTVNEAELQMKYVKGEWKVAEYKITPLL